MAKIPVLSTMCFKKIDTRHFRRRGRNNQRNATKIDIQHNQPMPQMTVNISNINVKNKCCEAELKKKSVNRPKANISNKTIP